MALDALWTFVLRPLLYLVFVLPFAYVRARRTRAVRIEAVLREPRHVLVWMTTRGFAEGVLDEIAEGVAAGRRVEPAAPSSQATAADVRLLDRLRQLTGLGVARGSLERARSVGVDAYALVDELPPGAARAAAWRAFALQTYGDRLLETSRGALAPETGRVVAACFAGLGRRLGRGLDLGFAGGCGLA
jgi:hypothetical protein